MSPLNSIPRLVILILTVCLRFGWSAIATFEVGEFVIVRNLKWKTDESTRAAVMQLNNSIVKILSQNTRRSERHEFTIQSLEDPSVQLAVPRKKLQHLSRIMVYDYTNCSLDLLMLKIEDLIQDPSNHVVVPRLPLPPANFAKLGKMLKDRYGRLDPPNVLEMIDPLNVLQTTLMTRTLGSWYPRLDANALSQALNFMSKEIPKELKLSMKQKMLEWAMTQDAPTYYTRILKAAWNNVKCTKFAKDSKRNVIMIREMQRILRVIQSNHPCETMRNLDWMLSVKQGIGTKMLKYWLSINDPKKYDKRQQLHVLWKWNDLHPEMEFIDVEVRTVFDVHHRVLVAERVVNLNPRITITSNEQDLRPKRKSCRKKLMHIMHIFHHGEWMLFGKFRLTKITKLLFFTMSMAFGQFVSFKVILPYIM